MTESKLNFKLEMFDGPLELLLTLITKQKINIYDIPISSILDQYLEYMKIYQLYNAEISSEFIVMACELLYIKSKMLLPDPEDDEDPRTELVQSLIEYSKVREAAKYLGGRIEEYFFRFPPVPKEPIIKTETVSYDVSVLSEAMEELKLSLKEEKEKRKKENVANVFQGKVASVESKVVFVLRRLVKSIPLGNSVSFNSMLKEQGEKSDKVATFLAILQLIQTGRLSFVHSGTDYIISLNKTSR